MNETFEFIEKTASDLRSKIIEKNPQVKGNTAELLKTTVETFGGKIVGTNNPKYYEINGGSLLVKEKGCFFIKLPLYTSPLRDSFTIAHELGHYILHYKESMGEKIFTRYGTSTAEVQANRFAAAFLMPREEFLEAREKYQDSVSLIAAHFQVSTDTVLVRMKYIK